MKTIFPDISHWQTVDWKNFKPPFVIMKATQGTKFIDSFFKNNQLQARENNIPCGFYHFANGENYKKEVEWFLKNIGEIREGELLALDAETGQTQEWCQNFLEYLENKIGFKPFIYAPVASWSEELKFPLWVARYGLNNGKINPEYPPKIGKWKNYTIWQFTSVGKIDGVVSKIDLNVFNGTIDELKSLGKPLESPVSPNLPPSEVLPPEVEPPKPRDDYLKTSNQLTQMLVDLWSFIKQLFKF